MRAVFSGAAVSTATCAALASLLLGGCQDSYASNAQRDTHMGEVQIAAAASTTMSPFAALPPAAPSDVGSPTGEAVPAAVPALAPSDAGSAKNGGAARDAGGPRPAHAPHGSTK